LKKRQTTHKQLFCRETFLSFDETFLSFDETREKKLIGMEEDDAPLLLEE